MRFRNLLLTNQITRFLTAFLYNLTSVMQFLTQTPLQTGKRGLHWFLPVSCSYPSSIRVLAVMCTDANHCLLACYSPRWLAGVCLQQQIKFCYSDRTSVKPPNDISLQVWKCSCSKSSCIDLLILPVIGQFMQQNKLTSRNTDSSLSQQKRWCEHKTLYPYCTWIIQTQMA